MSASNDGLTGRCPACGAILDGAGFVPHHMRSGDCPAVQGAEEDDDDE